ncbi:MAG TPA: hypothetical protein VHP33_29435 [Polyangiaceae bacterium]|nr:hypothetical protein [Polyangiaceae bacterium]
MLKGSAASVFALTMAAVGCSDSDKDNETGAGGEDGGGKGGTPSAAGSSNGGESTGKGGEGGAGATTPVGGADAGGADAGGADAGGADAGGAGGAGGADAGGSAVAKFCNDLTFGTAQDPMDTTFILEIGEGASKVSFTATTGACAPAACSALPVGTDIPYALFDADAPETEIDGGTLDILDGEVLAFYTDLSDDAEPVPVAKALTFDISAAECKDITYTDVYE